MRGSMVKRSRWFTKTVLLLSSLLLLMGSTVYANVLFQDDFSDPERSMNHWHLSSWEIGWGGLRTPNWGEDILLHEGVIELDNLLGLGEAIWAWAGDDTEWTDYVFEVDVRVLDRFSPENWVGLFVRDSTTHETMLTTEYGQVLLMWRPQSVNFFTAVHGEVGLSQFALVNGQWHQVKVVVQDDTINVYVDDVHVGEVQNVPPQGRVALYARNVVVQFDNVVVRGLE